MKLTTEKHEMVAFALRGEPGDDGIVRQNDWMKARLDLDDWSLDAASSWGFFSYAWPPERGRSFLKFVSELDEGYLLRKVSKRSEFDREATEDAIVERYAQGDPEGEAELRKAFAWIDPLAGPKEFFDGLDEAASGFGFDSDPRTSVGAIRNYPESDLRFAKAFVEFVAPAAAAESRRREGS